jgi:hypothetical protein
MRNSIPIAVTIWILSACSNVWGAEPVTVAMTSEHWKTKGAAEFVKHKGYDSVALKAGEAMPADLEFHNGTIEFDVEPEAMGTGVMFRHENEFRNNHDDLEYVYLRPSANCSSNNDCIQYNPVTHGVLLWDLFPQYQSAAPLRPGEWNHVKMIVSGRRMNIFINGAKSPTLKVGRLEANADGGSLIFEGPGFFANLAVTPGAVEGLSPDPEKDPALDDPRYVRNWRIAPFYLLKTDAVPNAMDLPKSSAEWKTLAAERGGLVNVTRLYGQPVHPPERPVTWLKTTITSDKSQTKKVAIGWAREIWVFANGRLVYADKNLYPPPTARKTPDGRCSLDNGTFDLPLDAGDNEITVALAANFYGWGLILRLDDLNGVHLATK